MVSASGHRPPVAFIASQVGLSGEGGVGLTDFEKAVGLAVWEGENPRNLDQRRSKIWDLNDLNDLIFFLTI